MSISMNNAIEFLQSTHQHLEEKRKELRKTELRDANRFNPFQFFRTDENGLSAVLAFLLNPQEAHGQGDLLLNAFLKKMKLHSFLSYDKVEVFIEKSTSSNRRHDIFIKGFRGKKAIWALSIENKLRGASDQKDQLVDYLDDLKKDNLEQYCLIYLSPFGEEPSNGSIPAERLEQEMKNNKLQIIDTDMLVDWLEEAPIVASIVEQFIEFFIRFLKDEIIEETLESDELVKYILENKNLSTALQIITAKNFLSAKEKIATEEEINETERIEAKELIEAAEKNKLIQELAVLISEDEKFSLVAQAMPKAEKIYEKLLEQLKDQLEEKCNDIQQYPELAKEGWYLHSYVNRSSRGMELGFFTKSESNPDDDTADAGVYISFDQTNYRKCILILQIQEKYYHQGDNKQLMQEINRITNELKFKQRKGYPYYQHFDGDLREWQNSTWLRIPTGELANEIFAKWQPLLNIFEENLKSKEAS